MQAKYGLLNFYLSNHTKPYEHNNRAHFKFRKKKIRHYVIWVRSYAVSASFCVSSKNPPATFLRKHLFYWQPLLRYFYRA